MATIGFVVILAIAILGTLLPPSPATSPVAVPSVTAIPSASPSAVPSPSPSVKPIEKPVSAKPPPKGSVMSVTGTKNVALTFDDGPWTWTSRVLDQLKAAGIKATFCLIGRQVKDRAALIRRMVAEGHTLCNHSWAHDLKLGTRTATQIKADIKRTDDAIHAVVPGVPIAYFRQPGGKWTAGEIKVLASIGKRPLGWSVDPTDWADPGASVIASRVLSHTRAGSIVLMHDGGGDRSQTSAALKTILPALKKKFTLIPLPNP